MIETALVIEFRFKARGIEYPVDLLGESQRPRCGIAQFVGLWREAVVIEVQIGLRRRGNGRPWSFPMCTDDHDRLRPTNLSLDGLQVGDQVVVSGVSNEGQGPAAVRDIQRSRCHRSSVDSVRLPVLADDDDAISSGVSETGFCVEVVVSFEIAK